MSEVRDIILNVQYQRIRDMCLDTEWIEEGSDPVMEETIYRARNLHERFLDITPYFPLRASPGPGDGSIDLYAYAKNATFLLNVPSFDDPDTSSISYHMVKKGDWSRQEGGFLEDDDVEKIRHIIEWVLE